MLLLWLIPLGIVVFIFLVLLVSRITRDTPD
jgi:hypothetical protein